MSDEYQQRQDYDGDDNNANDFHESSPVRSRHRLPGWSNAISNSHPEADSGSDHVAGGLRSSACAALLQCLICFDTKGSHLFEEMSFHSGERQCSLPPQHPAPNEFVNIRCCFFGCATPRQENAKFDVEVKCVCSQICA